MYVGSVDPGVERGSRWYRPVPAGWKREATLAEQLSHCGLDHAVVIPTSEYDAIAASELGAPLEFAFPSSGPPAEVLRTFADKAKARRLFAEHDVTTPASWDTSRLGGPDALDDATLENVFLKPIDSGRFSGTFVHKALRPVGRAAMREAVDRYAALGHELMLQEYIPGPASNSYLLDGFIDRHGSLRGLFARRRIRQYPLDFGNSSAVRSVDRSEVAKAEAALLRLLEAVGYRGIFNAEFKLDPRTGAFNLLEINGRTWLYAEFAARCGFNAPRMAWQDSLGLAVTPLDRYEVGRTVINPYYDIFAALGLRSAGEVRTGDVLRSWVGADQLLFAADDPLPSIMSVGRTVRDWAGRRVNRVFGQPAGTRRIG